MSRLGRGSLVVLFTELSPHLERASSMLASFPIFERKPIEMEPEERLAVYVRLRNMRRKMGLEDALEGENERDVNEYNSRCAATGSEPLPASSSVPVGQAIRIIASSGGCTNDSGRAIARMDARTKETAEVIQ